MSDSRPLTRLLLVSPDPALREQLRATLAPRGFEVVDAADCATARGAVARARADLAVIDLELPGAIALGDEFAAPGGAELPFLALVQAGDPALARLGSLCVDVVAKPADGHVLARRIARAIEFLAVNRELRDCRLRLTRAHRFARLGSFEVDWSARRVRCSEEARQILGLDDGAAELALDALDALIAEPQRDAWRSWLAQVAAGSTDRPVEQRIFRRDQSERVVRVQAERRNEERDRPLRLDAIVHDVTDRRRVEEELEYQTLHDDLTGLGNRRQLLEDLERAVAEARQAERLVAVLFLDLDRFKDVNETLGHRAGDRLLVTVAERLHDCLRENDPLARILGARAGDSIARPGGDEFAVVLAGLRDRDEAARVAQRILDVLARPFLLDDRELYLTVCIGIATWPTHGSDPLDLVKNAETAMYHAKERSRATFVFYDRSMDHVAEERLAVQSALRRALDRRDLEVWYQPRIELAGSRIVGMEALVRWHHPTLGLIFPNQFIPIAEESGLILQVGDFVLREACAQARRWHDAGFTGLRMAVNVSAEQFRDATLPDTIERIALEAGVPADCLEVELTESILMRDVDRALAVLTRLKRKGFHLSIDDFGTGYSSLAYLKRFPIDCLKIDCSFVRDVTTDAGDAAITAAILIMAHSLKLDVVAEGVETQAQLDFLRSHRCEQVQGFLFSEPLPAAGATALLEKQVVEPALAVPVVPLDA